MSDLSWLNPTPHAIAVYASCPLSPVGTQHSLPSGRYALLGPDFHRLDRTSLRLAHLFNHFVSARRCERHQTRILSRYDYCNIDLLFTESLERRSDALDSLNFECRHNQVG